MIKYFYLISLITCLIIGCTQKNINQEDNGLFHEININIKDSRQLKLSDISTDIRYVKLESRNDIYIPFSYNMVVYKNRIYIVGYKNQSAFLSCFDENGKLLFLLMNKGQGPGEYVNIDDIIINPYSDEIELLDSYSQKILKYDLDGNFLYEIFLCLRPEQFIVNKDSTYLFRSISHAIDKDKTKDAEIYNLYQVTKDGNQIISYNFLRNPVLDNNNSSNLLQSNGSNWFHFGYRDSVFNINSKGEILSGYKFNFHDNKDKFYRGLRERVGTKELGNFLNSYVGIAKIGDLLVSPNYLFVYYVVKDKKDQYSHHKVVLSQKSNSTKQGVGKIINDIDGIPLNLNPSLMTEKDELVFVVHNEEIMEEAEHNTTAEFIRTYNQIKPASLNDNMVLAFVKLKDF